MLPAPYAAVTGAKVGRGRGPWAPFGRRCRPRSDVGPAGSGPAAAAVARSREMGWSPAEEAGHGEGDHRTRALDDRGGRAGPRGGGDGGGRRRAQRRRPAVGGGAVLARPVLVHLRIVRPRTVRPRTVHRAPAAPGHRAGAGAVPAGAARPGRHRAADRRAGGRADLRRRGQRPRAPEHPAHPRRGARDRDLLPHRPVGRREPGRCRRDPRGGPPGGQPHGEPPAPAGPRGRRRTGRVG
jgi:hypothetical protein